ncbi:hypothetical protein B0H13DRAFT_2367450 [Mycena leptocephala]|nr:hypothetical protein B0H13DRAFT_2367450 [Mycena leptocephala]
MSSLAPPDAEENTTDKSLREKVRRNRWNEEASLMREERRRVIEYLTQLDSNQTGGILAVIRAVYQLERHLEEAALAGVEVLEE